MSAMPISALVDMLVLLTPKLEEIAVEHNSVEIENSNDLLYVLESAVNKLDDELRPLGSMHLSDFSSVLYKREMEEANNDDI